MNDPRLAETTEPELMEAITYANQRIAKLEVHAARGTQLPPRSGAALVAMVRDREALFERLRELRGEP